VVVYADYSGEIVFLLHSKLVADSFIHSTWVAQDDTFESPLRPSKLDDFMGQEELKRRLAIFISAAKERGEPLGHILLHGPPGLGKTTMAQILAKSMGSTLVTTSGPSIEKAADLAGVLTNLQKGDLLFIDEIHRLGKAIEEYLYPAMEDFTLDLLIDRDQSSRSVQVKLSPFTLVGATTRSGLISSPMRSRFAFSCRLDYYEPKVLGQILLRSAGILKVALTEEGSFEIAKRSRGTPRIANHLLRWVRDFAQIHKLSPVNDRVARDALEMLAVDHKGLEEIDKKILEVMIDHHSGGPVGVNTIAVAIGEDPITVAEVYEPYLIMQGFLTRTPRGRQVTPLAYKHLGKTLQGDPS
jgi:Holliday junction DNA helicase RuvB